MKSDVKQLPEDFCLRMRNILENDFAAFTDSLNAQATTSLRWNPLKLTGSPFEEGVSVPWHPQGVFLAQRPSFVEDPLFHSGAYYVQEAASMLLYQLIVPNNKPLRILDLCGAPGGKSTLLASAMHPDSLLVSNEVIRTRANILQENLIKWGHTNCMVTKMDPSVFGQWDSFFDLIIVDAPCSGEGLFRKDPRSIDNWSVDQVAFCASRQKRILAEVIPALKPGGQLIYSTCTYSFEENEENIRWILDTFHNELELDMKEGLEKYGAEMASLDQVSVGWRCYPHAFHGEGFFISRVKKISDDCDDIQVVKNKKRNNRPPKLDAQIRSFLDKYTSIDNYEDVYLDKKEIWYRPRHVFAQLRDSKYFSGIKLGTMRRKEITPDHHLAMSSICSQSIPSIDLTRDQALTYLRKAEFQYANVKKGWYLCKFMGVNLGWVKGTGQKLKNHYPMHWRIRKEVS